MTNDPRSYPYINVLKRRRDYLKRQIGAAGTSAQLWDKAEVAALDWAIKELENGDG